MSSVSSMITVFAQRNLFLGNSLLSLQYILTVVVDILTILHCSWKYIKESVKINFFDVRWSLTGIKLM